MSEEEKKAIEYLKARLYGNEGCELIDVAQSDLRIIIKLVDRVLKADKNWQEIYDDQEENIREKNNKICEFEFIIENQQKELNNLKEIEKSHKEENGKLRVELEQEKEKNKELNEALERSSGHVTQLTVENSDLKYQLYHKQQMIDELTQNEEKLKIEFGKEKEANMTLVQQNLMMSQRHLNDSAKLKNSISKDKVKEVIIPTPTNPISLEIQSSEFYKRILSLLEEK